MSILITRTGDDEGQFHLSRPLSDDESATIDRLCGNAGWDYDGEGDWLDGEPSDDFQIWINGPSDSSLLPAIAQFLESIPQ